MRSSERALHLLALLVLGATARAATATPTVAATARLATARYSHTATLLPDGTLPLTGGIDSTEAGLQSAEIFDPVAGTWTATGSLTTVRYAHAATLLADGRLLVSGGFDGPAKGTASTTTSQVSHAARRTGALLGALLLLGPLAGPAAADPTCADDTLDFRVAKVGRIASRRRVCLEALRRDGIRLRACAVPTER